VGIVSGVSEQGSTATHFGATLWLTGLSAAGKTTVAHAIEGRLAELGRAALVLDGDVLRRGLSSDLGLSPEDRSEHARRVAHVAALLAASGLVAIVALISPYLEDRRRAREVHDSDGLPFYEIWIDTPLSVCIERDPKGLYRRARSGELSGVTGIDAPYEPPADPELRIDAHKESPQVAAERVVAILAGVAVH
jgi:bifunctional enzyme CysN/CysC